MAQETASSRQEAPARGRHIPIAYKLAAVFTLLITGGMTALGLIIARDQTRLMDKQAHDFGRTLSVQMAQSAREPLLANDKLALEVIVNSLVTQDRIVGAALFNEGLEGLAQAGAVPSPSFLGNMRQADGGAQWLYAPPGRGAPVPVLSFLTPVVVRGLTVGHALITLDRSLMDEARQQTVRAVVGATVLLVLLGVAVSIILAERITRPIYRLMSVSRAISQGNYDARFTEKRNDELGALTQSLNRMAEGLVRKEQVERAFSRYVSPKVAQKVMNDLQEVRLGGQHVEASVLFADIVGFTSLSERLAPAEISALLNAYFTPIAQAANTYHGYIDKFIGDCVMVVFGVPEEDSEHAFHAAACALLIRDVVEGLNHLRTRQGLPTVQFKIGVNCGLMVAGNMGSADRMEYTVVGDAVNLASRLSSAAGPGEIIVSKELHDRLAADGGVVFRRHDTMFVRGKKDPVATYQVVDLAPRFRAVNERTLHRILKARVRAV